MKFIEAAARFVSRAARDRGYHYSWAGHVRSVVAESDQLRARVRGSGGGEYAVAVTRFDTHSAAYSCTCPFYLSENAVCKHVWAALQSADNKGMLSGWEARELFTFRPLGEPLLPTAVEAGSKLASLPAWQERMQRLGRAAARQKAEPAPWPEGRQILYVLRKADAVYSRGLQLKLFARDPRKNGTPGHPKPLRIRYSQISGIPGSEDRALLLELIGAPRFSWSPDLECPAEFMVSDVMLEHLLPRLCATGRVFVQTGVSPEELHPVLWDPGPPWEFRLRIAESGSEYVVTGFLKRGADEMALSDPVLLFEAGFVLTSGGVARLDSSRSFEWIRLLRREGELRFPAADREAWFESFVRLPDLPPYDAPEQLQVARTSVRPRANLRLSIPAGSDVDAELWFDYEGAAVAYLAPGRGLYDAATRRWVVRDAAAERGAAAKLAQIGFRLHDTGVGARWFLSPRKLPQAVRQLTVEGWHVEAEGKVFRTPGTVRLSVRSGIDWFELHGSVDFGETSASLVELLAALRRGESMMVLRDGSIGMLSEEWLQEYRLLVGMGTAAKDHLRYRKAQVGLLDALLAVQPEVSYDDAFERARDVIRGFSGIQPEDPPPGFCGELRSYQRDGLGWLHFLNQIGFGGCLADDMGLGKTIQVLALLEWRREANAQGSPRPSIVVVPKSLVFNWQLEAQRFTPNLRVLDHTGSGRTRDTAGFDGYDLILTTYGTLRRDIPFLSGYPFDYAILDEAQAVKNAATGSAKAARLLKARHRLAVTGTPIENHLGELWSLFEFLNPGMLGAAGVRLKQVEMRNPDPGTRQLLARALRPFILRRTKGQVARDLPPKVEQTLFCELDPPQRALYDDLRRHYRNTLLGLVEREGIGAARFQILEGLLRLRQAALHPGLLDGERASAPCAKLDALLPLLAEVADEGHKALVFSQFTSFLALLRRRLDAEKIPYAYMDGKTINREETVGTFQSDPDCRLFLISLKAGGVGLNLTAADYVYLLDPWWNPAVEAQAIDRTHRIGQTHAVFAYRLIARDTVEEKILELQGMKKDLADAIIREDNSIIRDLKAEDLALLLS